MEYDYKIGCACLLGAGAVFFIAVLFAAGGQVLWVGALPLGFVLAWKGLRLFGAFQARNSDLTTSATPPGDTSPADVGEEGPENSVNVQSEIPTNADLKQLSAALMTPRPQEFYPMGRPLSPVEISVKCGQLLAWAQSVIGQPDFKVWETTLSNLELPEEGAKRLLETFRGEIPRVDGSSAKKRFWKNAEVLMRRCTPGWRLTVHRLITQVFALLSVGTEEQAIKIQRGFTARSWIDENLREMVVAQEELLAARKLHPQADGQSTSSTESPEPRELESVTQALTAQFAQYLKDIESVEEPWKCAIHGAAIQTFNTSG